MTWQDPEHRPTAEAPSGPSTSPPYIAARQPAAQPGAQPGAQPAPGMPYQAGYHQPGPGPYPGGPYGTAFPPSPGYAGRRSTNALAIIALVLAFIVAPGGIICGVIARQQIRRTGEDGAGLALAGIILGSIFTALAVVYIVAVVLFIGAVGTAVSELPTPVPSATF